MASAIWYGAVEGGSRGAAAGLRGGVGGGREPGSTPVVGGLLGGETWGFHPAVSVFVLWGCMMVSKTVRIPKP